MSGLMGKSTTDLNMRKGPGTNHDRIGVLASGTLFDILAEQGDWLHISHEKQKGYVHRDYVQFPRSAKSAFELSVHETPGMTTPVVTAILEETQLLVFDKLVDWVEVVALGLHGYALGESIAYPRIAHTSGSVNLRTGPSTSDRILNMLDPGVQVHIWKDVGAWYYIADTVRCGYLHSNYVKMGPVPAPDPLTPDSDQVNAPDAQLAPAAAEQIHLAAGASSEARMIASIWNRFGGVLKELSAQLQIDPAASVAVLRVESGGRTSGADGRMLIRFENQIFYDRWGKDHLAKYQEHFKFNDGKRWTGHHWRPAVDQPWQTFHGDQSAEWQVLEFASTLDDSAAKSSISMGGAQIMGFNYKRVGYNSVQEMFTAFSSSERGQLVGFFNFVRAGSMNSKSLQSLRAHDFETFARYYNGPGQAATYGKLIRTAFDTFHALKS